MSLRKRTQLTVSQLSFLNTNLQTKHIFFKLLCNIFIEERFEYARKLKLCMSCLRTAGERLGRYALAKRQAVEQEDFLTAKLRKEQMEMYKNAVIEKLKVNTLLEENGVMNTLIT